jgi:competence protein ComEC
MAVPGDERTFLGGLILGDRQDFSEELRNEFVATGTIHMMALSGYNVTLIAEWIMKIFIFLPQYPLLFIGFLSIFLFAIMTGGTSTAIRASIMASLALLAHATGRNYDIGRALLLAGVAMIVINSFLLVFDVSFQLSFLATFAVIFISPRIERYFIWIKWKNLRDIASVTTVAYIFVAPFIAYQMGNISLVAFLPILLYCHSFQ